MSKTKLTRKQKIKRLADAMRYFRENCPDGNVDKFTEQVRLKFSISEKVMHTAVLALAGGINAGEES